MKTIFWGLFVLIQLILHLHRYDSDALSSTGRSFYIIGHMANDISQVEKHLAEGANALEIDVQFSPGARPVRTNHGFPCCFRDCFKSEVFSYMLKYLRDLSTPEHPEYTQQLALIKMNLKVRSFSTDMIYTAGERLAEALMVYLFDGGFSGSNVWVLLSVPSPQQVILFQGLRDAFRRYDMAGLLDRIGYTIGDNMDLRSIERSLDHLGIIDHIWIGDGSSSCLGGIRSRDRMERLIEERDIGEGNFDRVFHWTVDESLSMRTSLRTGVDAIVSNRPDRLLEILSEDEFYGRFRLATADDRPWDKIIEDESLLNFFPPEDNFGSSDISPTSADNDDPSSSSALVLANGDTPAISIDSLSLTEDGLQETGKELKDCKPSSETSLTSLLDDIDLKDAESEKPESEKPESEKSESKTTTAKPEDDDDSLASILKEIENSESSSGRRLSLSGRSTERLFGRSLFPNSELQEMLEKINENKEAKLTSDLIQLIGKMSAAPETPSISASTLQALLSMQTPTPSPTVPIGVLQALVGQSDSSSNILRLLANQPAPNVSPDLLRMLLNVYTPTTPAPGIPLHVVEALVGIQQRTSTSNINLDVLKLLIGSNSGLPLDTVLSLIKPTNVNNNAVSMDVVKALVKAMADKDKSSNETPVITNAVRRITKNKKNNQLKGKEDDTESKQKDDDLLDLSDVETTTKKENPVSSNAKNLTRNFPLSGGPPIPAMPGTSVLANFGPHGIHWKVLDKPGGHLGSPHPFPFAGSSQFGHGPHGFNDRPLLRFHPPLPQAYIGNKPLFQTYLPNYKVTVHQPINFQNPLRRPIKPTGQRMRFPKTINIHVPIPAPRPYMPPNMYVSSTPCPDPGEFNTYVQNYHSKPNQQKPHLVFPAHRPPSLPGHTHLPFRPDQPSGHPLLPQRPSFPRPTLPNFDNSFESPFEPPIFIDDIDSIDDFLKKNNNTHNIPRDLFSSIKGVKETNFSSQVNVLEENEKPPAINSQVSLDSIEELTRVNSRGITTTEKPSEIDSVDDIIDSINLEDITTTADPFEELMTAFEKINNDKEAVANFLKRVNLSSALTTMAPTLKIENKEPQTSTSQPGKYSLQQIFNLPPTAGLGWNGESINQAKLEQVLRKQEKQERPVVIIENSPLIVVPPETATWPNRNVVHKRETTPPPDDYDEFFGTTPISHAGNKPSHITISKPSEGLTKTGGKRPLMPGEVEIEIPGELFAQMNTGDDKKNTLAKLIENLDEVDKQHTQGSNNITLTSPEKEQMDELNVNDRNDKMIRSNSMLFAHSNHTNTNDRFQTKQTIQQLKPVNDRINVQQLKPNNYGINVQQIKLHNDSGINVQQLKSDNSGIVDQQMNGDSSSQVIEKSVFLTEKPSTGQRRHGGVSLRHPNVPYTIVNSVNPTTPYPKRVLQRVRSTPKSPSVHIHYRGSGKSIRNLDSTTTFPLLYHTMKSQVRKMQEQSEQKYSQITHHAAITTQSMESNRRNNEFIHNNTTRVN